jgi:hypothetical protein
MVVHNFHICWPCSHPAKTDAVLLINTNTMLSLSVPFQGFQSIAWGDLEFMEGCHGIKLIEFAGGNLPQCLGTGSAGCPGPPPVEDILCTRALE